MLWTMQFLRVAIQEHSDFCCQSRPMSASVDNNQFHLLLLNEMRLLRELFQQTQSNKQANPQVSPVNQAVSFTGFENLSHSDISVCFVGASPVTSAGFSVLRSGGSVFTVPIAQAINLLSSHLAVHRKKT